MHTAPVRATRARTNTLVNMSDFSAVHLIWTGTPYNLTLVLHWLQRCVRFAVVGAEAELLATRSMGDRRPDEADRLPVLCYTYTDESGLIACHGQA